MKKSKGLKAKIIENGNLNAKLFSGQFKDYFLKIIPKIGKSLQKATRDYKKELRDHVKEDRVATSEFWDEIRRQGLFITKKFGPRQRLSMIATNASPLPKMAEEDYQISEYCDKCGTCIKMCPVNAILEEPIEHEDGTVTRIDSNKCFPYFYENVGCSICIKVCPFHKVGYDKLFKLRFYS
ncbi:MAG: 4Fe-4S dicluster domain-containing protein [Promethearchaeota archaeon]